MPPAKTGKRLAGEQADMLRRWITRGGHYEPHWAFVALRSIDPPAQIPSQPRSDHPLDRYVHQRLSHEGIQPSR